MDPVISALVVCSIAFAKVRGLESIPDGWLPPVHKEVPDEFRNWNVEYEAYEPVQWDAPCGSGGSCDLSISSDFRPAFNSLDGRINRRRAKACNKEFTYKVINGYPLNPAGRTGFHGRGVLPRWGPNHLIKLVLLDLKKGVLSMLVKADSDDGDLFISFFVDDARQLTFPEELRAQLELELRASLKEPSKVAKVLQRGLKNSVLGISGSIPSDLNTDNAWVEQHVYMLDCSANRVLCKNGFEKVAPRLGLRWQQVNASSGAGSSDGTSEGLAVNVNLNRFSSLCFVKKGNNRGLRIKSRLAGLAMKLLIILFAVLHLGVVLVLSPIWIPFLLYCRYGKKNQGRIDKAKERLFK